MEAAAYGRYVDEYNRFWRQFFDPIAMRLDETEGNSLQLSTFILPLLDSELYDQVRKVVATAEKGAPLKVPSLTPDPVLAVSLNLQKEAWVDVAKGMSEMFRHYSGIDSEILDYLGPSAHLAIGDSDPIIALGSGDLMGAFGGNMQAMRGREMMFIPMAISVLTRPSVLMVELTDPQKVLLVLKRAATVGAEDRRRREEVRVSLQKIEGRDAWVYNMDMMGVVKLSFGVEVQGNYLIITNLPWSHRARIASVAPAPLNGAMLQANPGAADLQLPALFASACDQERAAAMQGIGCLFPLMAGGVGKTPAEAAAAHALLFGFKPVHPAPGEWTWNDGALESTLYGSASRQKQPEYPAGKKDFGLFGEVERVGVGMQFEDAGLRTSVRWTLAK